MFIIQYNIILWLFVYSRNERKNCVCVFHFLLKLLYVRHHFIDSKARVCVLGKVKQKMITILKIQNINFCVRFYWYNILIVFRKLGDKVKPAAKT